MTEELVLVDNINIEDIIYEVRGKQVMLDSDLAHLYNVETKRINEAVKNNLLKFPERYSFVLSDYEKNSLWSKFSTANISKKSRVNPRVFTEQGVYMLATILKSKIALEVTINIMDTFVKMRKYISNNILNNEILINHESRILKLENTLDKLNEKEKINTIFCEGQIYDAYSLLLDILNNSKEEIVIIDNYAGKELLDILKNINKKIIIISSNINDTLIKKYNKQYSNVIFKYNTSFHDRFIIIDKKELYSYGSSFKDLGHKCFALNKMEDKECLKVILSNICKEV